MHIVFRTDSSDQIGTGHVMRCLTLAETLRQKGANCIFICRNHPQNIYAFIKDKNFPVHLLETLSSIGQSSDNWLGVQQIEDAQQTIEVIKSLNIVPNWLIIDHYGIDIIWESLLKKYVEKIMVIDDLANRRHDCDILLDQNYTHVWDRYTNLVPAYCLLLLGPEYAILRPEFLQARQKIDQQGRSPFDPRKVLIFFGGVDSANYTGKALDILAEIGDFAPEVVIGIPNPHRERIQQQMQNFPEGHLHIQINNMAEIMLKCSWYLGAGGSITWERICLGLTGIVVPVAENQLEHTVTLTKDGFGILSQDLTSIAQILSTERIFTQLEEYQKFIFLLVDGWGAEKVCLKLLNQFDHKKVSIREVNESDMLRLFLWANDPEVRNNSFNNRSISLQEHRQWFLQKVNSSSTKIYILEYEHLPIGQIRFDLDQDIWLLSYSISSSFRGHGIGGILLKKGEEALKKTTQNSIQIQAKVKSANLASLASLKRNGYAKIERDSTLDYIVLQK